MMDQRPLVVTTDDEMLADVLRIAAATGVEVLHSREPTARGSWRAASCVVLDIDQVPRALAAGLPRRDDVIAVARTAPDAASWDRCVRLGVRQTVLLQESESLLVELFARTLGVQDGDGRVIGVIGACGGVGASVLTAAVAVAAQRDGCPVLLVDGDRWGPGLDVVLGLEESGGVRWSDLAASVGRLPPDALHRALPGLAVARGEIPVLGFDRDAPSEIPVAVAEVVVESARRAGDTVVMDVPRVPTAAGDRVSELADLVVLVVPADVRGCFAAQRRAAPLVALGARVGLVVRGPSPGGLGADDISGILDLPLVATLRPQARLARDLELGRPPGADPGSPLGRAARAVLTAAVRGPG